MSVCSVHLQCSCTFIMMIRVSRLDSSTKNRLFSPTLGIPHFSELKRDVDFIATIYIYVWFSRKNFHWGLQHKSRLNCWSPPNHPPLNAFLSRLSLAQPVDLCVNSLLVLSSPLTGSTDTESNHFIGAMRNEELSKVLLLNEDELASRH